MGLPPHVPAYRADHKVSMGAQLRNSLRNSFTRPETNPNHVGSSPTGFEIVFLQTTKTGLLLGKRCSAEQNTR